MEWVETTAKTVDAAQEAALDQLGVGADDAEFELVEEPKPGLFGRMRGEARIRARVKPEQVRPKQERRRRSKSDKSVAKKTSKNSDVQSDSDKSDSDKSDSDKSDSAGKNTNKSRSRSSNDRNSSSRNSKNTQSQEKKMSNDDRPESQVSPQEVGDAAVIFMDGLTTAFGASGSAILDIDGLELEVNVSGEELGLLVGPGGRTLNAIQDLARVSAQRRLGDHDTRLRIDVAGYRGRREAALGKFARGVAEQVRTSGEARSLEVMPSADRKVIHDALNEEDGVSSRSQGEDPNRRIIVEPA